MYKNKELLNILDIMSDYSDIVPENLKSKIKSAISVMEQQLQTRWQITGQKTLMHQQPRECLLIVQLLAMDRLLPRLEHRLTADRQGKNTAVLQAGISFQAELPIPDRVIPKIQIMRKGP